MLRRHDSARGLHMDKDVDTYLGTPSRLDLHYKPASDRYDRLPYRRCGASGLKLPVISLGLWQNFGDEASGDQARAMVIRAFDLGITYFDLANNYGRPPGSAEKRFGCVVREDLSRYRDELIVATKAGYDMWPGPYGEWGSRKYLMASVDQSLTRLGLDYVDIFYSHRFDPETPLEETMRALCDIVRAGKALYVGISSYGPEQTRSASAILRSEGVPAIVHQPSYSLFNRWIETSGLLDDLSRLGMGCATFSALEQGLLSEKYLADGSAHGRMAAPGSLLKPAVLTDDVKRRLAGLTTIARRRGQTLSQLALAWVLRDPRVTSAIVGSRSVAQLDEHVSAAAQLAFSPEELREIDSYAEDLGLTLWPPNC